MMEYKPTFIGGFTGNAGGGKSLTLAYMCIWQMLKGRIVWSNMHVKTAHAIVNRKYFYGLPIKPVETRPLDIRLLYMLDESFVNGTVSIDELGYFADSRQSGSIKNRLINACIRQVRHRNLNFFYTALDFRRVDSRLRDETDFLIECEDITFKPWGRENKLPGGVGILQRYYDLSGKITGRRTNYLYGDRRPYKVQLFKARPVWDCYNTHEIIPFEEAMGGVELDIQKTRISNRTTFSEEREEQFLGALSKLKQTGNDKVESKMLWAYLESQGFNESPTTLGRLIPKSVKRIYSRNEEAVYDLSGF